MTCGAVGGGGFWSCYFFSAVPFPLRFWGYLLLPFLWRRQGSPGERVMGLTGNKRPEPAFDQLHTEAAVNWLFLVPEQNTGGIVLRVDLVDTSRGLVQPSILRKRCTASCFRPVVQILGHPLSSSHSSQCIPMYRSSASYWFGQKWQVGMYPASWGTFCYVVDETLRWNWPNSIAPMCTATLCQLKMLLFLSLNLYRREKVDVFLFQETEMPPKCSHHCL